VKDSAKILQEVLQDYKAYGLTCRRNVST